MTDATVGLIVGVLVVLVTRAIDWLLPKGWHFKAVERYGHRDHPEDTKDEDE